MRTAILAASAIALALTAGPALAAKTHAKAQTSAEPKQPVPYAELNAYLKATPKQRATSDWWSGASTGMAANTASATPAPTAGADTSSTTSPTTSADPAKGPEGPASTSSAASSTAATPAPSPDPAATPTPPK